jgi:hypothetical protein
LLNLNTWKSFFFSRFFFALEPILFGAGSTHVAYIKARRSEVCPDIVGERAEFRDTDLSYKTLRRRKPSEILAQIQRRGFRSYDLSLAQYEVFGRERDIGSKITGQV